MENCVDFAFLDSGTGGIPYMLEIKKRIPTSRCVYLGDTAHFPYGEKSESQIIDCASRAISDLIDFCQPREIVVACNTISVTSLQELRNRFSVPIVGTVPAIKLAADVSLNKRIGLLATNATVRHPYNQELIKRFASDCKVFARGDPDLISFVEHKLFTATLQEKIDAIKPAVDYFASCACDTIILGCTHFTHIAQDVKNICGKSVRVVDSRDGVAKQAIRVLEKTSQPLGKIKNLPPDCAFFVTSLRSEKDRQEYDSLCKRFALPWCGLFKKI